MRHPSLPFPHASSRQSALQTFLLVGWFESLHVQLFSQTFMFCLLFLKAQNLFKRTRPTAPGVRRGAPPWLPSTAGPQNWFCLSSILGRKGLVGANGGGVGGGECPPTVALLPNIHFSTAEEQNSQEPLKSTLRPPQRKLPSPWTDRPLVRASSVGLSRGSLHLTSRYQGHSKHFLPYSE